MVILSPVRIDEGLCFVTVAGLKVGPSIKVKRATMEAIEQVSKLHSVSSEEFVWLALNPHLTSGKLVVLLRPFSLDVKIDDALIDIVIRIIELSDDVLEIWNGHLTIVPALIFVPVNSNCPSLQCFIIGWPTKAHLIESSPSLIVSVKLDDLKSAEIDFELIVASLDHISPLAYIGGGIFEPWGPGQVLTWNHSHHDSKNTSFHSN